MVDWTWTNGAIAFALLCFLAKMLWFLERISEASERLAGLRSPVSMFRRNPLAQRVLEEQTDAYQTQRRTAQPEHEQQQQQQPPQPAAYPVYQQPHASRASR